MSIINRMSTIFILKEILELIYEESKRGELVTTDVGNRLRLLEKQMEEKNKELSRLYTENIRLENTIKKYESEFEILSKMPIIPFPAFPNPENKSVESDKYMDKSKESEKKEKSEESGNKSMDKSEDKSVEEIKKEKQQKRKEYMAEYLRNYRKVKRAQKNEMKV